VIFRRSNSMLVTSHLRPWKLLVYAQLGWGSFHIISPGTSLWASHVACLKWKRLCQALPWSQPYIQKGTDFEKICWPRCKISKLLVPQRRPREARTKTGQDGPGCGSRGSACGGHVAGILVGQSPATIRVHSRLGVW
jgi:hypothetical protein